MAIKGFADFSVNPFMFYGVCHIDFSHECSKELGLML